MKRTESAIHKSLLPSEVTRKVKINNGQIRHEVEIHEEKENERSMQVTGALPEV